MTDARFGLEDWAKLMTAVGVQHPRLKDTGQHVATELLLRASVVYCSVRYTK